MKSYLPFAMDVSMQWLSVVLFITLSFVVLFVKLVRKRNKTTGTMSTLIVAGSGEK
jgi:hypothetical protein